MPETDPSITPRCVACGSDAVIQDAIPSFGGSHTIKVAVEMSPGVTFFPRKPVTSSGSARVCGDCGYVMVYADEPRTLWDGYIERLSNDLED